MQCNQRQLGSFPPLICSHRSWWRAPGATPIQLALLFLFMLLTIGLCLTSVHLLAQELVEGPWRHSNLDAGASMLIPVPGRCACCADLRWSASNGCTLACCKGLSTVYCELLLT